MKVSHHKRNSVEKIDFHYSTPSVLDRMEVENKQIQILIFTQMSMKQSSHQH